MYFCISNSAMYEQEFQGDVLYMLPDRQFGLTGKPNPYVITFPTRNN